MKMYYYLFYSFIIYALIGWTLEVVFHMFTKKKFINRGFLYGPLCPIYGVSAVFFIVFLTPIKNNSILIFIGGALVASIVEFITGYVMEMLFNAKWWDYTDEKFNIKGYICLRFSAIWGGIAVIFIKIINPRVSIITYAVISQFGEVIYNILLVALISDIVLTINSLITFKQVFVELQEILVETKNNMDKLKGTINIDSRVSIQDRINHLSDLRERLSSRVSMRHKTLLRAYPQISSKKFDTAIEDLKNRLEKINIMK